MLVYAKDLVDLQNTDLGIQETITKSNRRQISKLFFVLKLFNFCRTLITHRLKIGKSCKI